MAAKPTDPELLRQLDEARTTGEPVAAVVQLKRAKGKPADVAAIEAQTSQAIARATKATGEDPDDVHVMGHMATAYVPGSEKFLREFVDQPQVVSAVANQAKTARRPADAPLTKSTSAPTSTSKPRQPKAPPE